MMLRLIQKPTIVPTRSKPMRLAIVHVARRWILTFSLWERWFPHPKMRGLPSRRASTRAVCLWYLFDLFDPADFWFTSRRTGRSGLLFMLLPSSSRLLLGFFLT